MWVTWVQGLEFGMPDLQLSTLHACGACDPLHSPSFAVSALATGWQVEASRVRVWVCGWFSEVGSLLGSLL